MDQDRIAGIARQVGVMTRRTLGATLALGGPGTLIGSVFAGSGASAAGKRRKNKNKNKNKNKKNKQAKQQSPLPPPPGYIANCADRTCGNDGRGGSCGACAGDQVCIAGACCMPESRGAACAGRCGTWINNCGQPIVCKSCPMGQQCLSNGSCAVVCAANADCSGGNGCSNPTVEGTRHCITGPLMPFAACQHTSDCPPGAHCQDIGFGGVCITLHT